MSWMTLLRARPMPSEAPGTSTSGDHEGGSLSSILTLVCGGAMLGWVFFVPDELQRRHVLLTWGILGAALAVLVIAKKSARFLVARRHLPLWTFILALFGSVTYALDKTVAIQTWLGLVIPLLGFYFVSHELFASEREAWRPLIIIGCIFGVVVSLLAVAEWWIGSNLIYERWVEGFYYERYMKVGPTRQPLSTQSNPAVLGSLMVCCLPFSLSLAGHSGRRLRVLGVMGVVLNVVTMVLTLSRAAFVAMVCAAGVYSWYRNRRWTLALLVFVPLLVASLYSADVPLNRYSLDKPLGPRRFGFQSLVYGGHGSLFSGYRERRLVTSMRAMVASPFLGVGMNHLRMRFYEFFPTEDYFDEFLPRRVVVPGDEHMIADNMYLTLLAETGVVGFAAFGVLIASVLGRGMRRLHRLPLGEARDGILIPLAALTGLLVNMGGYDLLYWSNPLALFGTLCGILVARSSSMSERRIESV